MPRAGRSGVAPRRRPLPARAVRALAVALSLLARGARADDGLTEFVHAVSHAFSTDVGPGPRHGELTFQLAPLHVTTIGDSTGLGGTLDLGLRQALWLQCGERGDGCNGLELRAAGRLAFGALSSLRGGATAAFWLSSVGLLAHFEREQLDAGESQLGLQRAGIGLALASEHRKQGFFELDLLWLPALDATANSGVARLAFVGGLGSFGLELSYWEVVAGAPPLWVLSMPLGLRIPW